MVKHFCLSLVFSIILIASANVRAESVLELSHSILSNHLEYVVKKGDYLIGIAGRYGMSAIDVAQINHVRYDDRIFPGQRLRIDSLHIVPETLENGILINLPQRLLFFFRDSTLSGVYSVGLGKVSWPTPTGDFEVIQLKKNPTWVVPISIQEEMAREGNAIITKVPPGPANPLGKYWIGISIPGYGIHSTNSPTSIYQFMSHGCIRVHPDDIETLFPKVKIGDVGKIIYAPVLLAKLDDGQIYLEANPDVYNMGMVDLQDLKDLAESNHLTDRIDWEKARQVIEKHEGVATQVNLNIN